MFREVRRREGSRMATTAFAPTVPNLQRAVPAALINACFVLAVINISYFPAAYFSQWWIWDPTGLGIPTDFVNVWAAGKLVLDGHPAQAYDWDIQKQIEVALLGQDFIGYFAWHYPPPFLFVASALAHFPYTVAFIGWVSVSFLPYLAVTPARSSAAASASCSQSGFRWCSTTRWSGRTAFSPRP